MKKIKVLLIFGTRPEAIKMAPLVKECENRKEIDTVVCVTAQHREMLDQVLHTFDIKPKYDLNVMKKNQTLSQITSKVIEGIEEVIIKEKPDLVLVHGDTTTAFAGGLAAYYQQVKICHIEAGLRTNDKYSPFPEEMNRQMIDCLADFCFAPTDLSKSNLLKENRNSKIYVTGNTVIDAMKTTISSDYKNEVFDWVGDSRMILLTCHRRENIGEGMENIFKAVNDVLKTVKDIKVVFPVHLNPKVREIADKYFKNNEQVKLIEPLDVFDFHNFQKKAYLILTDSGGIQEEASALGKPVVVLRNTTERQEGVDAGKLVLAGTGYQEVYDITIELLTNEEKYNRMLNSKNPYGDGTASKQIVDIIVDEFSKNKK